jgi:hypothetical protein
MIGGLVWARAQAVAARGNGRWGRGHRLFRIYYFPLSLSLSLLLLFVIVLLLLFVNVIDDRRKGSPFFFVMIDVVPECPHCFAAVVVHILHHHYFQLS